MGRPSDYSERTTDIICQRLSLGESLNKICKEDEMPDISTVFRWLAKHDAFRDKYAHAREVQAETMAEEILSIADDSSGDVDLDSEGNRRPNNEFTQRSRLRVDTRKWLMSKMLPKKYGDRLAVAGDESSPLSLVVEHISKPQD